MVQRHIPTLAGVPKSMLYPLPGFPGKGESHITSASLENQDMKESFILHVLSSDSSSIITLGERFRSIAPESKETGVH